MKNILKYTAFAALTLTMAGCEEFVDHTQTVGGTPKLVYVEANADNFFQARIVHRPAGSTGTFETEFAVNCNSPVHAALEVALAYDASLVEGYNAEHGTDYAVLPEEYLVLENTILSLPENAVVTEEKMKVSLSAEADLSQLTARRYLAPLAIRSQGFDVSEELGTVWVAVETETNIIRTIGSVDEMIGFPAAGRSHWLADCSGFKNLFDGITSTSCSFDKQRGNVVVIDMGEPHIVTGFSVYSASGSISYEYSLDGESWQQAGTPVAGEYVASGQQKYIALESNVEAQYLRLTADFTSNNSKTIGEFNIYKVDSTNPAVYAITGTENVLTTKIVHKKGVGSTCDLAAPLKAYATAASQSGYSVSLVADASLVEAYNTAHGTTYAALPVANIAVGNTPLAIAAGATVSEGQFELSLTGDLTQLTDKGGYLAALRLSAQGLETSPSRGVVYVVVAIEQNLIRAITSADEMVGFAASGRSAWTADNANAANLFDGNNSTGITDFASTGNVLTFDMKQTRMITGLHFYTYNLSNLSIEYSLDGQTFETAGTVASGESVFTGGSRAGNYYMAFSDYLEARFVRLTFGFSGYYRRMYELEAYEIESTDPTIYTICGSDNVFTGTIVHHVVAGSLASLDAAFNVMTTISSDNGWTVGARIDNSLVAAYNAANRTSYAELPAANVLLEGAPCAIAAGANMSAGQIRVSLTGDFTGLRNAAGYLIPVTLTAPDGAVVSEGRGTVYVVLMVEQSSDLFRKNFTVADIAGTPVADHTGWTVVACDEAGLYPYDYDGKTPYNPSYDKLFDFDEGTYVRTWGGPISFTVDLGKEYDMTGMMFASSAGYSGKYAPNSVMIEYSLDGENYTELGTPAQSTNEISVSLPYSYVALYGSQKVRYLRIVASYGSNMGTGEFNIYAK